MKSTLWTDQPVGYILWCCQGFVVTGHLPKHQQPPLSLQQCFLILAHCYTVDSLYQCHLLAASQGHQIALYMAVQNGTISREYLLRYYWQLISADWFLQVYAGSLLGNQQHTDEQLSIVLERHYTLSLVLTVIRFHVIFYVWSFLFSLVSHTLTLSERFLLVTNSSKSCYAMVLSTPRSLLAFSGSTAFVTKLNRSQLSSANAFVKLSMVVVRDSMLFSCQFTTAAEKAWWCVWAGDEMPAISQASPASLASSGEINKNLERA